MRKTAQAGIVRKLKEIVAALLVSSAIFGSVVSQAWAAPKTHGASHSSHKANNQPKTVPVRSYTKKNGTVVKAHKRATPR
jgi:hypothetical protein